MPDESDYKNDPRSIVLRRVTDQARRWPDLQIAPLDIGTLTDPRNARLAQAIYGETIRRWMTIQYLLDLKLNRPFETLEPRMQAVLMVGATQVLFMDQVPDHAAVDQSVRWARGRIRVKAGGLVNAILRQIIDLRGKRLQPGEASTLNATQQLPLSDGGTLELSEAVLPRDRLHRLAIQTSHPRPLVARWSERTEYVGLEQRLLHGLVRPPTTVSGAKDSELFSPHDDPGFGVWTGDSPELSAWLEAHPDAWVQDPGSAQAVESTRTMDFSGRLVVDLCAGLGTKTLQLRTYHPTAKIVASDPDKMRFAKLAERFRGDDVVTVVPTTRLLELAGKADVILLDVPCSNSGVFGRRVEARYRMDDRHLQSLGDLQRQIIVDAIRLRSPSARLIYSTCSLEPEENQEQAAWIAKWHQMPVRHERQFEPSGVPGDPPAKFRDGSYHAILG